MCEICMWKYFYIVSFYYISLHKVHKKPILYQFGMHVPKIAQRQLIYTHIKHINAKIWDKINIEYKNISLLEHGYFSVDKGYRNNMKDINIGRTKQLLIKDALHMKISFTKLCRFMQHVSY